MLVPYPTDYLSPARILLARFTGTAVPYQELAHAAYQLQGVAMGQLLPHEEFEFKGEPPLKYTGPSLYTEAEMKLELERACDDSGGLEAGLLDKFNWQVLLAAALKILTELISK